MKTVFEDFQQKYVKCQYKTSYIANFIHLGCGTQAFWHQGPVSWKRKQFFWGSRPGRGGNSFRTIQAVLLCTLFLLLLHQLHLRLSGIRSQRLGTPDLEHLLCFLPRTMILGWVGLGLTWHAIGMVVRWLQLGEPVLCSGEQESWKWHPLPGCTSTVHLLVLKTLCSNESGNHPCSKPKAYVVGTSFSAVIKTVACAMGLAIHKLNVFRRCPCAEQAM